MAVIKAGVVKIVNGELLKGWYTDEGDIPTADLNLAGECPEQCVVLKGDEITTFQGGEWAAPTGN